MNRCTAGNATTTRSPFSPWPFNHASPRPRHHNSDGTAPRRGDFVKLSLSFSDFRIGTGGTLRNPSHCPASGNDEPLRWPASPCRVRALSWQGISGGSMSVAHDWRLGPYTVDDLADPLRL